jgi:diguanylate cyclase (GGDEF)-like protein/PAS domain S-box-containing protein
MTRSLAALLASALAAAPAAAAAQGVFDGPGGQELLDSLVLAAYAVGIGYAALALVAYHSHLRRRRAEAQVRLADAAFDSSVQGMMITDASGTIVRVNPAFERLTGYGRAEALGRDPRFLASLRHDPAFFRRLFGAIDARGCWEGEMWCVRRDGEEELLHMTLSAVRGEDGAMRNYAASFVDITERRLAEQRVRHLAEHDLLTDLPNRALLRTRTEAAIERARRDGRRIALMFADLDRFKNVNDSLGHAVGDQLLRRYARRLLSLLRTADLVGRQGGDEFVVLLPDLDDTEDASRVAVKLLQAMRSPFPMGTRELLVTCSIGIALYPDNGADFETLMRNADTAMYAAKESGRDCFRFHSPEMSARAAERLELEGDLRRALRSGELWLALQPQVRLDGGALAGVEALVRWRHRARGELPPGQFIPVAEDSGLVVPLGEWVLREACRLRARWLAAGLQGVPIAVNVSAVQFRDPGFVGAVGRALEESGLAPALLELEVTESVVVAGFEQAKATLDELERIGLRLSIDDFGTGYSSLAYLKRLPVDKLKIDRSFVIELPGDADSRAIAGAVVSLGRSLDMRVIAEGVENEAQAAFLREAGCHEAQGYLFARPLPAAEFEARWLPRGA